MLLVTAQMAVEEQDANDLASRMEGMAKHGDIESWRARYDYIRDSAIVFSSVPVSRDLGDRSWRVASSAVSASSAEASADETGDYSAHKTSFFLWH